jgi:hypothetical protein
MEVMMSKTLVQTQAGGKEVRYLGGPRHVTHARDCRWADRYDEKAEKPMPVVPSKEVPTTVGRCTHCGGGNR